MMKRMIYHNFSTDVSNNKRRGGVFSSSSFPLLTFMLKHYTVAFAFFVGILVGLNLDRGVGFSSSYSTQTQIRHLENNEDYTITTRALPLRSSSIISPQTTVVAPEDEHDTFGWKTIQVFYGSTEHMESLLPNDKIFFSQARQDEVVLSLLRNKRNGYFVDLASNDATLLSNSYALEKHYGWKGLCIEPNPNYWYNLTHTRTNCELIGAVVGKNRMDQVDFKFDGLEHGGIIGADFDNDRPHLKKSSNKEYTVTLLEIFKKFKVPTVIDYLSLDVEGAEEFIMNEFPLKAYRIKILTIERPKENLRRYLESHGYLEILRLSRWGETLWIHGSFKEEMDMTNLQDFHGKRQYEEQKRAQQQKLTVSTTTGIIKSYDSKL